MPRTVKGKSDNTYFKDNVEIYGGKGFVHKLPTSKYWYFRTWIVEEEKHLRQSLRTTDLDEAIDRAEKLYIEVRNKVQHGIKYFGISFAELGKDYLDYQQGRVDTGKITKGRFDTIKTQINRHIVPYIGAKTTVGSITASSFFD